MNDKETDIKMVNKERFQITATVGLVLLALMAFSTAGCSSTSYPLSAEGLPAKEYLVGGGFMIDWVAPEDGTAYLVEEKTKKILGTKSLKKGERFDLSFTSTEPEEFEKMLGVTPAEARFSLYFVPYAQDVSTKQISAAVKDN